MVYKRPGNRISLEKEKNVPKNLKIYQHLGTNVTKNEKTPGNTFKNSI